MNVQLSKCHTEKIVSTQNNNDLDKSQRHFPDVKCKIIFYAAFFGGFWLICYYSSKTISNEDF